MMKFALIVGSLFAVNTYSTIDLSTVAHLSDYAIAVLIAMMVQPWVVSQFDS